MSVPGMANQDMQVLNAGFRYAHSAPGVDRPPPRLGEHTREILEELGYGPEEMKAILAKPEKGARNEVKK